MQFDAVFRSRRSNVLAKRGMVATSQPLAAQAGLDILKANGSAADAAVATAAMLNVVQPTSTGIGGDCFALYWDAGSKEVTALNGSGRSPAGASIDEMRRRGYRRMPMDTGHAVTVPGTVAGWSDLLERHGRMSLADALQPAIWTAENGYPVTELMARSWQNRGEKLLSVPVSENCERKQWIDQPSGQELLIDGRAPRAGEVMRLPTLAATLHGIAEEGKAYIYRGEFARLLSEYVQRFGGWIVPDDMSAHVSTWDEPITTNYRGVTLYECPPNGQGLAAILAANLAAGYDLAAMGEADRVHIMIECMRLAFADAERWICDPALVDIPLSQLVSVEYAEHRRHRISGREAAQHVFHGELLAACDTVYVSVVDGEGNACSFISSLYDSFGTGLVVPGTGVCLQNRGACFVLEADHPNALAPNKRPYHTIIPGMTSCDGELHMSFGMVGGYVQPQGHLQILVNMLDLGMAPQQALDMPRWSLVGPGNPLEPINPLGAQEAGGWVVMDEGWDFAILAELTRRGHRLIPVDGIERLLASAGQIILRDSTTGVLTGGSDPRHDGCAVGW
jgi:gamma-glutamyltranspeptidase/glutathione hydrolase